MKYTGLGCLLLASLLAGCVKPATGINDHGIALSLDGTANWPAKLIGSDAVLPGFRFNGDMCRIKLQLRDGRPLERIVFALRCSGTKASYLDISLTTTNGYVNMNAAMPLEEVNWNGKVDLVPPSHFQVVLTNDEFHVTLLPPALARLKEGAMFFWNYGAPLK